MNRDTRTIPKSGSTRTSANCAPNACIEYCFFSSPGFVSAWPTISAGRGAPAGRAAAFASASSHAACTADETLAVVCEPPEPGETGSDESPYSKRTRSTGRSNVSAATWVKTV